MFNESPQSKNKDVIYTSKLLFNLKMQFLKQKNPLNINTENCENKINVLL